MEGRRFRAARMGVGMRLCERLRPANDHLKSAISATGGEDGAPTCCSEAGLGTARRLPSDSVTVACALVAGCPSAAIVIAASAVARVPLQIGADEISADRGVADVTGATGAGVIPTEIRAALGIGNAKGSGRAAWRWLRPRRSGEPAPRGIRLALTQRNQPSGYTSNAKQAANEIATVGRVREGSGHVVETTIIHWVRPPWSKAVARQQYQ